MRVRAARYTTPLSGVKTVNESSSDEALGRFEDDPTAGRNAVTVTDASLDCIDDDDIIDVEYTEYGDDADVLSEHSESHLSTLSPPQVHDEFSRDNRVARYQNMMSGYSHAQFQSRRSDEMLLKDMAGYRWKLLA